MYLFYNWRLRLRADRPGIGIRLSGRPPHGLANRLRVLWQARERRALVPLKGGRFEAAIAPPGQLVHQRLHGHDGTMRARRRQSW